MTKQFLKYYEVHHPESPQTIHLLQELVQKGDLQLTKDALEQLATCITQDELEDAYDKGYDEGYDYGYDRGKNDGHNEGYDEGYDKGLQDAEVN